jgi:hypothetical protein
MAAVMPFVVAVLLVVAARRRAEQQGTVYPVSRGVLLVAVAGSVGATVAVAIALMLRGFAS